MDTAVLMVETHPEVEAFYCCGGQGHFRKSFIVYPEIEFTSQGDEELESR